MSIAHPARGPSPSTSAARRRQASRSRRAPSAATGACRSPTATADSARRLRRRVSCLPDATRRSRARRALRARLSAPAATRCRCSRSRTSVSRGSWSRPFPVYWLGASFDGLAVSEAFARPQRRVHAQYGNCVQGGQGYCVPPLRIVTSPDNGFLPGGSLGLSSGASAASTRCSPRAARRSLSPPAMSCSTSTPRARRSRSPPRTGAVPINAAGVPGEALPARLPNDGFEQRPLPTQVPNPLRVLGVPFGR